MKLNELLSILDDNMEIWINCYDHAEHYDGRNSIDERYNSMYVGYITQDAKASLTKLLKVMPEYRTDKFTVVKVDF